METLLAVIALVNKGIDIAQKLYAAGKDAAPALEAIKNLTSNKEPTQADLDATEATLDGLMSELNSDLPAGTQA